jgi:hypothetical protein
MFLVAKIVSGFVSPTGSLARTAGEEEGDGLLEGIVGSVASLADWRVRRSFFDLES